MIGQDDVGNNGTIVTKTFNVEYAPAGPGFPMPIEILLLGAGIGVILLVVILLLHRRSNIQTTEAAVKRVRRKRTPKGA